MSDNTVVESVVENTEEVVDEQTEVVEPVKVNKLAARVRARREAQVENTKEIEQVKEEVKETFTQVGGDGELETYDDPFAKVTDEMIAKAEKLEAQILETNSKVTKNYLVMARDLSTFKANEFYRARGYDSFQAWGESPELAQVGWRTAYDLVRIADEVLPMMERNNLLDEIPSISNLYALLPILNDDDGEAKFLQALEKIKGLSVRDAKETIRVIRGLSSRVSGGPQKTFFNFRVDKQTEEYKTGMLLSGLGNEGGYEMGKLRIAAKDWAAFEAMVGEKNVIWPKS